MTLPDNGTGGGQVPLPSRTLPELETCESGGVDELPYDAKPRAQGADDVLGTTDAIIALGYGGSAIPDDGPQAAAAPGLETSSSSRKGTWGGARNTRHRTSTGLTSRQVRGIRRAALDAWESGAPLNRHTTVHWGVAGLPDAEAAAATGRLLKLIADWARTRGWRLRWLFVREHDAAAGKGAHVHLLLHVPASEAAFFSRRLRRWLRRVTGKAYRAGTVRSRPIGPTVGTATTAPRVYKANLSAVLAYVCKGASPAAAAELGLGRVERTGVVMGKRAGWSQSTTSGGAGRPSPDGCGRMKGC